MRTAIDRRCRAALSAASVVWLAACATATPPTAPLPPVTVIREVQVPVEVIVRVPEISDTDNAARSFLAYFDRVRQMAPAELGREFTRLDPPNSPQAIVELALALGQTRNPADTVRALALLDPLLRSADAVAAPWQPWARVLAARYAEQRRVEDHAERQTQALRDSQRRQDQLTQQLEALKAIERSLTTRPAAPASAPAAKATPP